MLVHSLERERPKAAREVDDGRHLPWDVVGVDVRPSHEGADVEHESLQRRVSLR